MYSFSSEVRKALEAMPVPLAYYTRDDKGHIEVALVSDGLCQMMDADRERLTALLNGSLFDRVHPDDVDRLVRTVREFAARLCGYDVIYRGKYNPDDDYHYIHSIGRFQPTPDGSDLAVFVYPSPRSSTRCARAAKSSRARCPRKENSSGRNGRRPMPRLFREYCSPGVKSWLNPSNRPHVPNS